MRRMPVGIVTGASRGLGLALMRALVERGWRLVVDGRGEEALAAAMTSVHGGAAAAPGCGSAVTAIPGDVADPVHRRALVEAAGGRIDRRVNTPTLLGRPPRPALADYPPAVLGRVYEANVFAPLKLPPLALARMPAAAAIVNVTSDAAVEPYEGWGGYGSSKAALEQLTAILAVERHELRVYTVDPGDMRTQMHQEAFPGEDISDRPPPRRACPACWR